MQTQIGKDVWKLPEMSENVFAVKKNWTRGGKAVNKPHSITLHQVAAEVNWQGILFHGPFLSVTENDQSLAKLFSNSNWAWSICLVITVYNNLYNFYLKDFCFTKFNYIWSFESNVVWAGGWERKPILSLLFLLGMIVSFYYIWFYGMVSGMELL